MFNSKIAVLNCFFVLLLINTINTTSHRKKFDHVDLHGHTDKELFEKFLEFYDKDYEHNSEEGRQRFLHFQRNLNWVKQRNSQNLPYTLALNKLADISPEEHRKKLGHIKDKQAVLNAEAKWGHGRRRHLISNKLKSGQTLWAPVNWSSYFLDARAQGKCGGCWAFATLGVLEAAIAIKGGAKQYLSPQYLINCDTKDKGCNGGAYPLSFDYLVNNGVVLESVLPFTGEQTACLPSLSGSITAKISKWEFCSNNASTSKCSEEIVYILLQKGPLAVGVDASSQDFLNYSSGIFTFAGCTESNHAVILAGYGSQNGLNYWIVRNSWGVGWGESGYIRIARNAANKNSCFIADEAFLPIL